MSFQAPDTTKCTLSSSLHGNLPDITDIQVTLIPPITVSTRIIFHCQNAHTVHMTKVKIKIVFFPDTNSSEHLSSNVCLNLRSVCVTQLLEIYFAFPFNPID